MCIFKLHYHKSDKVFDDGTFIPTLENIILRLKIVRLTFSIMLYGYKYSIRVYPLRNRKF